MNPKQVPKSPNFNGLRMEQLCIALLCQISNRATYPHSSTSSYFYLVAIPRIVSSKLEVSRNILKPEK